jgi:hypothetical protein
MPIVAAELKYYESTFVGSGGVGSLGGAITVTEIPDNTLHNIFDVVESAEAVAGALNYRCIYVKNTNATLTLANPLLYIQTASSYAKNSLGIALGTSAINGIEQTVADELSAPIGPIFNTTPGVPAGESFSGDLPAGEHMAIWLLRTVQADSTAQSDISAAIALQGDTT